MNSAYTIISEEKIPALLKEIPKPPKKLYVRGTLPSLELKWLAVVGSRACSTYGRQVVRHLISALTGYPIVIVSGLAYGIDAEAHKAALDAGLLTVAIPGSGVDDRVLYPRAHVNLAKEILKAGGALVSEFEPLQKAADYTFPQRNRIMAGISHATLVIEAKEKSGSLITARLATDYNRELLVVPGSIFSEESKGTHQFLKLGATPVTHANDILAALHIESKRTDAIARADLSAHELAVFELLIVPLERNELIEKLSLPISEAQQLLSLMEIKGLIVEHIGYVRRM